MTKEKTILGFTLILLTTLYACGFKEVKSPAPETSPITYSIDQVGYKEVNDLVFKPNCVQCHNQSTHQGSIILDSYVGIKTSLGLVQDEVVGKTMPPDGPIPQDQIDIVAAWIKNGAPELAPNPIGSVPVGTSPTPADSPTPTVSPSPSLLVPTYTSIRDHIFVQKCFACHSATGSMSDLPLDDYAKMMANPELIIPKDPDNSTVYIEASGGTMPPENHNPVTAEEVAVIKTWIQNGAPEFAVQGPTPSPTPVVIPTPVPSATPIVNPTPIPSPTPRVTPTPVVSPTPAVLLPTYASIHDLVFTQKCLACHKAGGSESSRPLDNYEKMMATPSLIKPGSPASSTVYTEISNGYMPPKHYTSVTASELAVINTWILNGAPKGP